MSCARSRCPCSSPRPTRLIDVCRGRACCWRSDHHLCVPTIVERARAMISDVAIGRVTFVRLRQAHDWGARRRYPLASAPGALAGGGTLLDNGCHCSTWRATSPPVAESHARTGHLGFDIEVEDNRDGQPPLRHGALGLVETSWTATGWDQAFVIDGTKGSLEYPERYGRPLLRYGTVSPATMIGWHPGSPSGSMTAKATTAAPWRRSWRPYGVNARWHVPARTGGRR